MSAVAVPKLLDLDAAVLARFGVLTGTEALLPRTSVLSLDWPELERVLPDHGLPRGVIEIASPVTRQGAMRGGATSIALRAVRAVHQADDKAWCAWITPAETPSLYAPSVVQAGVDLDRLLVVRPEASALARAAVKVAAAGAFDLVVLDAFSGLDGRLAQKPKTRTDGAVVVRKLALAAEERGTTFVVLTNVYASRAVPWPVALRLEVERRPEAIALRVTKDRRGAASTQHVVRLAS